MKVGDLVREYYLGEANHKLAVGLVISHYLTDTAEGWYVLFPERDPRPFLMHYVNLEVISESW